MEFLMKIQSAAGSSTLFVVLLYGGGVRRDSAETFLFRRLALLFLAVFVCTGMYIYVRDIKYYLLNEFRAPGKTRRTNIPDICFNIGARPLGDGECENIRTICLYCLYIYYRLIPSRYVPRIHIHTTRAHVHTCDYRPCVLRTAKNSIYR